MTTFAIILSSLALLAAVFSIGLVLWDRKRSKERNTALMQYAEEAEKALHALDNRVKALENGSVPDFEKAKQAANAVNDFNAGITGILGYDPFAALQAQRQQEHGGERS